MKHFFFLLFTITVVSSTAFPQKVNITYDIQLKEFEVPLNNHYKSPEAYSYLDNSILNKIISSYITHLFNNDSLMIYNTDFGWTITAADILKNTEPDNLNWLEKSDSVIFLHSEESDSPYYFINRNGRFSPDSIYIEDPVTFELVIQVLHKNNLFKSFSGLDFSENWKYDSGKFMKEIVLISPVQIEERNDYDEYTLRKKRLGSIKMNDFDQSQSEILIKNIYYDVRIAPLPIGNYPYSEEDFSYSSACFYNDINAKNNLLLKIFKDLKANKIKAYAIKKDQPDLNSQLNYEKVKELLSSTTEEISGANRKEKRKYQEQKIIPVVDEIHEYQLDEWGDVIYSEENNDKPVILSTKYDTTGYDTVWIVKKEHLKMNIQHDTLTYYDEKTYEKFTDIVLDTCWVLDPKIQNKITAKISNKIIHDKLENITTLRFYETWYINKNSFSIYKKINGIIPILESAETNYGELVSKYDIEMSPLFKAKKVYISFN